LAADSSVNAGKSFFHSGGKIEVFICTALWINQDVDWNCFDGMASESIAKQPLQPVSLDRISVFF